MPQGRDGRGQFAAGASALTFRSIKREEICDTGYIRWKILMIFRLRYPLALCLKHKVRSHISSLFLQRTVACLRCRKLSPSVAPLRHPRPVPFRWDTSPFIGIRPLSSGYVPFYRFSRSFIQTAAQASLGIRQSPLGERATLPIFGPSGRQERLNCWVKNLR